MVGNGSNDLPKKGLHEMTSKLASYGHLASRGHKQKTGGTRLGFDFPHRELYCSAGVVFTRHNVPGAPQDTTPVLPADHPLPSGSGADMSSQVSARRAVAFDIVEVFEGVCPRSNLSRHMRCLVDWGSNSIETLTFIYLASGRERDALVEVAHPLVVKAHRVVEGATNANAEEWDSYLQLPVLRRILPTVYGYFEVAVPDGVVALLLVERVAFTLEELIRKLRESPPTPAALNIIKACVLRAYHTMVECARDGLFEHDWHIANVGFTDTSASRMVLVDWQKNHLANAVTPYRARWESAFRCFYKYLPGPHTYGADDITDKPAHVQAYILQWRAVLTRMF